MSEEDRLYKESIEIIRKNIQNGVSFDIACEAISVKDEGLRKIIVDDALKIEIAELHYGKNMPLPEVARRLDVSMERILKANEEMLEDVMKTFHHIPIIPSPIDPESTTH